MKTHKGGRTRTYKYGNQNPMPYLLATPLYCQMCMILLTLLASRFPHTLVATSLAEAAFVGGLACPCQLRQKHFSYCPTLGHADFGLFRTAGIEPAYPAVCAQHCRQYVTTASRSVV